YQQYLHRAVDPGGLASFTGLLAAGRTGEQVAGALVGSPEYFQSRGGGTEDGFVNALFQDALNRSPTAAEGTLFVQYLHNGLSRGQVADLIFGSPNGSPQNTAQHSEYLQVVVTKLYQK